MDVEVQSMAGNLFFDSETGHLKRSQVTLKMKVNAELNGQKFDQNIAITTTMRLAGDDDAAESEPAEEPQ